MLLPAGRYRGDDMAGGSPRIRLGAIVAQPRHFDPVRSWHDSNYYYRYDSAQQICKRTPLNPAAGSGGYYKVISESNLKLVRAALPQVQPVARRHRRRTWRKPPAAWKLATWGFAALFVAAGVVMVYPFWPALYYRVAAPNLAPNQQIAHAASPASDASNAVIIPKIGVRARILEAPTLDILDQQEGVWHQTGTFSDNFVLAGHRFKYLPPNTSTLFNLDKLQPGDVIIVDWKGRRTVYTIASLTVVPATQTAVIRPTPEPQITIYTCNEKRETHRVVAVAKPLP